MKAETAFTKAEAALAKTEAGGLSAFSKYLYHNERDTKTEAPTLDVPGLF